MDSKELVNEAKPEARNEKKTAHSNQTTSPQANQPNYLRQGVHNVSSNKARGCCSRTPG
jgi:hypothetical protein